MRINILFVLQTFGTGGSERVVLELCRGLDQKLFNVSAVSLCGGILQKEFQKNGIGAINLEKGRGVDLISIVKIRSLIRKDGIHIVNAHHFSPFIHASLASLFTQCEIIYTDHTVQEIETIGRFWKHAGILLTRRSFGVIGISASVSKKLKEKFGLKADKTFTILNSVDLDRFRKETDIKAKKKELGIKQDEKVIGIVANLRKQKNHKNLIRAFSLVQKSVPNSKLVIVGEGETEKELKKEIQELRLKESVIFLGARLDVDEIYPTFDAYCLCSHYEGLPLTILEAMACRIPVVGTRVDGIKDVIINNQNGLLVDPNDSRSLATALCMLIKDRDLVRGLTDSAYEYVSVNFNRRNWLKRYENFFVDCFQQTTGKGL